MYTFPVYQKKKKKTVISSISTCVPLLTVSNFDPSQ